MKWRDHAGRGALAAGFWRSIWACGDDTGPSSAARLSYRANSPGETAPLSSEFDPLAACLLVDSVTFIGVTGAPEAPVPMAELRRLCRMRTETLCATVAKLTADGTVVKTDLGYRLAP